MAGAGVDTVVQPRSFKLLEELESQEKSLKDPSDLFMYKWNANIIGPQNTNLGEKFFTMLVVTDANYPRKAPAIFFSEPLVKFRDVDPETGMVKSSHRAMRSWAAQPESERTIFWALKTIREDMLRDKDSPITNGTFPEPSDACLRNKAGCTLNYKHFPDDDL